MDQSMKVAFDYLARAEVGKAGSEFIFVSIGYNVVAVFVKSRALQLEHVIGFAESLGESAPVIVEDETGIAWENNRSIKEQDRLRKEAGED